MVYLVLLTIFIPIEFKHLSQDLVKYLGGLLAICWMVLLGFIDDVLNLKWRHKLWIPTIASLPLLIVYYMNIGRTVVVLPFNVGTVNLGFLYYIYMGMLAVFCTNSINIYAGINGLVGGVGRVDFSFFKNIFLYFFLKPAMTHPNSSHNTSPHSHTHLTLPQNYSAPNYNNNIYKPL